MFTWPYSNYETTIQDKNRHLSTQENIRKSIGWRGGILGYHACMLSYLGAVGSRTVLANLWKFDFYETL